MPHARGSHARQSLAAVFVLVASVGTALGACGGDALDASTDASVGDAAFDVTGDPARDGSVDASDDGRAGDAFADGEIHFVDAGNHWDGHAVPDAPTACGPDTCVTGCCDSQGHCVAGLDVSLCGGTGNRCVDCAAQGALCVAYPTGGGVCAKSAACGPHNCLGCCQGDTCVPESFTSTACGTNGEACTTCAAGDFCKGTCVHPQPTCDATNCAGCCAGTGSFCVPGVGDNACGHSGQECQTCQPSQGQGQCVPQNDGGGACNGVDTCTPLNCSGCCDGNVCRSGTSLAQCGANGTSCTACSAGQQCVGAVPNGGSCQSPPTCTKCDGCCQGNACIANTSDTACGPGSVCQDCTAFGQICVGGACIDPYGCNPATCPGCCIGSLCAMGNQDIACAGTHPGMACISCTNRGTHCVSGGCR